MTSMGTCCSSDGNACIVLNSINPVNNEQKNDLVNNNDVEMNQQQAIGENTDNENNTNKTKDDAMNVGDETNTEDNNNKKEESKTAGEIENVNLASEIDDKADDGEVNSKKADVVATATIEQENKEPTVTGNNKPEDVEMVEEIAATKIEIEKLKEEKANLASAVDKVREEKEKLASAIKSLKATEEEMRENVEKCNKEIKVKTQELNTLNKKNSLRQSELKKKNEKLAKKKEDLNFLEENLQKAKQLLDQMKKRVTCTIDDDDDSSDGDKRGLTNLGNTCFMNSVLQCLLHVEELKMHCLERKPNDSSKLVNCVAEIFKQLSASDSTSPYKPDKFYTQFSKVAKHLCDKKQHDAQEFLSLLLSGMNNELAKMNDSTIEDLFKLTFSKIFKCTRCGAETVSKKLDNSFILFLSTSLNSKEENLGKSIGDYCKESQIEWDCYNKECANGGTAPSTMRRNIIELPKVLIIRLKTSVNNNSDINYPKTLNMAKYLNNTNSTSIIEYKLIGSVVHQGSSNGGHYFAVCLDQTVDQWYELNDTYCQEIKKEEDIIRPEDAYMLFYEKIIV